MPQNSIVTIFFLNTCATIIINLHIIFDSQFQLILQSNNFPKNQRYFNPLIILPMRTTDCLQKVHCLLYLFVDYKFGFNINLEQDSAVSRSIKSISVCLNCLVKDTLILINLWHRTSSLLKPFTGFVFLHHSCLCSVSPSPRLETMMNSPVSKKTPISLIEPQTQPHFHQKPRIVAPLINLSIRVACEVRTQNVTIRQHVLSLKLPVIRTDD